MAENVPAFKILNSWSQENESNRTYNFTASLSCVFVPSATKNGNTQCKNVQFSPHMYRYSPRSERKHENCAPVSSRAGNFPVLKLNSIQNNVEEGVTTTFRIAPTVVARCPTDRRAPTRFPTGGYLRQSRLTWPIRPQFQHLLGFRSRGNFVVLPDYEH